MNPAEQLLRDDYVAVLAQMRLEHEIHDGLERKATMANRRSWSSYERLNEMRARSRALREAFAALTGYELDPEMAKLEDQNSERVLSEAEKKERKLPESRERRTPRPEYHAPGSVVRERGVAS